MRMHDNSAVTKVSEEGGARGAPGAVGKIILQSMVKNMLTQLAPLQPMEVQGGAGGCALKETTTL